MNIDTINKIEDILRGDYTTEQEINSAIEEIKKVLKEDCGYELNDNILKDDLLEISYRNIYLLNGANEKASSASKQKRERIDTVINNLKELIENKDNDYTLKINSDELDELDKDSTETIPVFEDVKEEPNQAETSSIEEPVIEDINDIVFADDKDKIKSSYPLYEDENGIEITPDLEDTNYRYQPRKNPDKSITWVRVKNESFNNKANNSRDIKVEDILSYLKNHGSTPTPTSNNQSYASRVDQIKSMCEKLQELGLKQVELEQQRETIKAEIEDKKRRLLEELEKEEQEKLSNLEMEISAVNNELAVLKRSL